MKKEFKVNEVVYYIKDNDVAMGVIMGKISDRYYLLGRQYGYKAEELFKKQCDAYDYLYKKSSKRVLVQEIVDYIFEKYTEDERVKALVRRYEEIETRNSRRRSVQKYRKGLIVDNIPTYLVTKPARDVLEPLIDAEYFKALNYGECPNDQLDAIVMGMSQLDTRIYKELKEKIKQ